MVVDQFTGFEVKTDLQSDGLHPTDAGDRKMAEVWYPTVVEVLKRFGNATVA